MKMICALKPLLIGIALIFDGIIVLMGAVALYVLCPGPTLPEGTIADRVVVIKHRQGDGKTPEGFYVLDWRNPQSCCHLSLHVSYPNEADFTRAQLNGQDAGGDIMIHALPNGYGWIGRMHRLLDWTHGCIAVTDQEMDLIWNAVPDGTPIEILP